MIKIKESLLTYFGLFISLSTIFCCALPIILVTLGMGAVFATMTVNLPFITWLAIRSIYLFAIATILIVVSGYFIFIKSQTCPTDKSLAEACSNTKKINKIIWYFSTIILIISFFFKYLLILFL